MTIDVNVCRFDETFFDELDDIMEDTMVQMFIIHPSNASELLKAKEAANSVKSIFYSVPISFHEEADQNCVAFSIHTEEDRVLPDIEKPIFIDEALLEEGMIQALSTKRGVILNATREHPELKSFFLAIGPENVEKFETTVLSVMDMDSIVLQSGYPNYGFGEISASVKVISDLMFRPEQSIIARATKNTLELLGFR